MMEEMIGGPIPEGYCVHHIDGDPSNDCPSNLQLLTHGDHARIHHEGVKNPRKARRRNIKVTRALVDEVFRLKKLGYSQKRIGFSVGIHQTMVSKILNGKIDESRL